MSNYTKSEILRLKSNAFSCLLDDAPRMCLETLYGNKNACKTQLQAYLDVPEGHEALRIYCNEVGFEQALIDFIELVDSIAEQAYF